MRSILLKDMGGQSKNDIRVESLFLGNGACRLGKMELCINKGETSLKEMMK